MVSWEDEKFSAIDPEIKTVILNNCLERGLKGGEFKEAYLKQLRMQLPNFLADAALANMQASHRPEETPLTGNIDTSNHFNNPPQITTATIERSL